MAMTGSDQQSAKHRGQELLRAGRLALAQGNRRKAHDLWKQAAMVDPRNEQVWLALLDVVTNYEDKRVCLENILSINPNNRQAAGQLNSLMVMFGETPTSPSGYIASTPLAKALTPFGSLLRWIVIIMILLALFALGALAGVLLNLI